MQIDIKQFFLNHPYKGMIIFSSVAAIFLDIFSAIMSILVYLYRMPVHKKAMATDGD